MASAKPGIHVLKLKQIEVAETLVKGGKFIKWDDDSQVGQPVSLKVDPKGYILYWRDQQKEMDCLDISIIRDTRTGKFARHAKDKRFRETLEMGASEESVEEKTVTVVFGSDLCNMKFLNFTTNSKATAQLWCDELFSYATNMLLLNSCPLSILEKTYVKLQLILDSNNKIAVNSILKQFAHKDNKVDRKRVEKALEAARQPSGKNEHIAPNKFSFEDFMNFYLHLVSRGEAETIFHELGAKKKPYLTAEQFKDFLNNEQRDPRLNEILYPFVDVARAKQLIQRFENNRSFASKSCLSQEGLLNYLLSDENSLVSPDKLDLSQDMNQPLSHYFIKSSHNTYLTGHQITGKSSVEMYRQCLLSGCRCVELDCWDGKSGDQEPIITHGFTMETLEAVAESAFKVSDQPVILSFENHCSAKQQAKMAQYCRKILGSALLVDPLDSNPLTAGASLPAPSQLAKKFLIKTKTCDFTSGKIKERSLSKENEPDNAVAYSEDDNPQCDSDEPSDGENEAENESSKEVNQLKAGDKPAPQEAEFVAGTEISQLVNYVRPTQFTTFENADEKNRAFECCSFGETQATNLLKEQPAEMVKFNKRQFSRIYPKGTRVDSGNYMPQVYWNAGCQLVALNYQTLDLPMQLNLGIFEFNKRSGYILKPDFMRRKDRSFDPFVESTVDGVVAGTVELRVISGQLLAQPDKKTGVFVEVDMFGLPADTVRKKFKTKVVPGNTINPVFNEKAFVFRKVILPSLAVLRIAAMDDTGKLLGHRVLPIEAIRPGYRNVCLRNELNQPQGLATLFVHIVVRDYVPDGFADFANALTNPIRYQSELERHAAALAVFEEQEAREEDAEVDEPMSESNTTPDAPATILERCNSGAGELKRITSLKNEKSVPSRGSSTKSTSSAASAFSKQDSWRSYKSAGVASAPPTPKRILSVPSDSLNESGGIENLLKDFDPDTALDVSAVRLERAFQKFLRKREKDLINLSRKHTKAKNALKEMHDLEEEKLLLLLLKEKKKTEKLQRTDSKKACKQGDDVGVLATNHLHQLQRLSSENIVKVTKLQNEHKQKYSKICTEHLQYSHDLKMKYLPQEYTLLDQLLKQSCEKLVKRLKEMHDREVNYFKEQMNQQSKEELRQLNKASDVRDEVSRLKREAQQRYIALAVQERQNLKDLREQHEAELWKNLKTLTQELHRQKDEEISREERDFAKDMISIEQYYRTA